MIVLNFKVDRLMEFDMNLSPQIYLHRIRRPIQWIYHSRNFSIAAFLDLDIKERNYNRTDERYIELPRDVTVWAHKSNTLMVPENFLVTRLP